MIKVTKTMLKRFLEIMDEYGEFVFGDDEMIQKQLETCLNTQGYWSGSAIILNKRREKDYENDIKSY